MGFFDAPAFSSFFHFFGCIERQVGEHRQSYQISTVWTFQRLTEKGHPPSAYLRYGEEDSISPSTLVLASIKG